MAGNKQEKKNPLPANSLIGTQRNISDSTVYVVLLLLAFILYGNTLDHNYAQDDTIVITGNTFTQKGFAGIKDILTHDTFYGFFKQEKSMVSGGRYRPLSLVTFAIEQQLLGQSPAAGHFINILLYALTAIAIYLMLKRLLLNKENKYSHLTFLPYVTALLFLAHPIHTEAVANIKSRDEILSMLFSITAANLFLKYIDEGRKISSLLLGFMSLFLGLLSKENSITFFVVIPMMIWFFRKSTFQNYMPVMGVIILASGIFLALRQHYTNTSLNNGGSELMNNPFLGMTASEKYATIIFTFGKYLSLLALPITLTSDYYPYQIAIHNFASKGTLISLIICAGGLIFALVQLRKKTLLSFCILFFIITFSVVSNVVFPVGTFMSERFLFMPSLAFCLMLAYLIGLIPAYYRFSIYTPTNVNTKVTSEGFFRPGRIQVILLLVICAYSIKTIARNTAWKDDKTLFSTDVTNSPNSAKINDAMGGELVGESDSTASETERLDKIHRAIPYLQKAIKIYPGYTSAWLTLGNAYVKGDKDYPAAFNAYEHALLIQPDFDGALHNMVIVMNEWKNVPAKIGALKQFIKAQPGNATLYYQLGQLYITQNFSDSAIMIFRRAISINKNYSEAYSQMGRVYAFNKNMLDSSIYYFHAAMQTDATNMDSYESLGVVYGMKKDYKEAEETFLSGLKVNPNDAKLYLNMAVNYSQMGEKGKVQDCLNRAYELDPSLKPK